MQEVWNTLTTQDAARGLQYNQIIFCNPVYKGETTGTQIFTLNTIQE